MATMAYDTSFAKNEVPLTNTIATYRDIPRKVLKASLGRLKKENCHKRFSDNAHLFMEALDLGFTTNAQVLSQKAAACCAARAREASKSGTWAGLKLQGSRAVSQTFACILELHPWTLDLLSACRNP